MAFNVNDKFEFRGGDYVNLAPSKYYTNGKIGYNSNFTYYNCNLHKGARCLLVITKITNKDYIVKIYPETSSIDLINTRCICDASSISESPISQVPYKVGNFFELEVDKTHFEELVSSGKLVQTGGVIVEPARKNYLPIILGGVAVIGLVWYFSRKK